MNLETITKTFIRTNNALGPRQIMQHVPVWFIRRVLFQLYRQITAHVDRVIVHEQVFQDILHSQYRIPREKIVVIAHGVEDLVQIPKQKARTQLGIEQKSHVCLFIGYYTGYKGLDTLVDGFSIYTKKDPQSMLLIGAGKHPKLGNNKAYQQSYRSLQKKTRSLLPANQYTWKGFIPEKEIPLYYSAADVVLFPYTSALAASGPMSLALGYATPFLVSDAFRDVFPDMPEIIFSNTQAGIAHALNTFFQGEKKIDYENLRKKRLWNTVARDTYQLYLELVTR
jgi:glycosyltransferase involved in cell wall biosynthesis